MVIQLNRIILFCLDIALLKSFYQEYFHFELIEEIPGQWVVLKAGNIEIAFHKIGPGYVESLGGEPFRAESNTKLVFEMNSDLAVFRNKLLAQGVKIKDLTSSGTANYWYCDGEDPEGNVFQLVQRMG